MSADTRGIRELAEESLAEQMIAEQIVTRSTKEETLAWIRVNQPIQLTIKRMTAFAESIVEQCCKDICERCADTVNWEPADFFATLAYDAAWRHQRKTVDNCGKKQYALECKAAPIRSRGQRGEGQ